MRQIKLIALFLLIAIGYMSCNDCEDVEMTPCNDRLPNTENCGITVVTYFADTLGSKVGEILDTRDNLSATPGTDWGPNVARTQPANWTVADIGRVFGIAIDADENIYLASSDIYAIDPSCPSSNQSRPHSPSHIYKCEPPLWLAQPFIDLPSTSTDALNGIGNIAYDKINNQLFATHLEDGKIYQITTEGVIVASYDPWGQDTGASGIVAQDERVWAIGVNYEEDEVKVYFPRVTATERSMYSITLVDGNLPTSPDVEVIEFQNIPGNDVLISDIAFSSNGEELLLAEREESIDGIVYSYSKNNGVWNSNLKYNIGIANPSNPANLSDNSGGGVDFAYTGSVNNPSQSCDEYFWATSNWMKIRSLPNTLYAGIQGISYAGNNPSTASTPNANQDTDLFIDFDGAPESKHKMSGKLGDVEVFDCSECIPPCFLNDL